MLVLIGVGFLGQLNSYAAISYNVTSTAREFLAWNDLIGWIDFNSGVGTCDVGQGSVCVSSQGLRGYASSSAGKIYLDCGTYYNGSCPVSFGVTSNGFGALDGYAWNDVFGWFRFRSPTYPAYQVLINARVPNSDLPPSDFGNWAWNPVVGWVSFNCNDLDGILGSNYCGSSTSSYKVATDWYASSTSGWLESATFDTGSDVGAQFNSILWRGDKPDDTMVQFYFATSSSQDGPWDYKGPYDSESASQDPDSNLFAAKLDFDLFNNSRYFRYKIVLVSNQPQTLSPTVEDVIVNWSP